MNQVRALIPMRAGRPFQEVLCSYEQTGDKAKILNGELWAEVRISAFIHDAGQLPSVVVPHWIRDVSPRRGKLRGDGSL